MPISYSTNEDSPESAGYMAKYVDENLINAAYDAASKIGSDLVAILDLRTHNLVMADRNTLRANEQVPEHTRNSITKSAQEAVGMDGISFAGHGKTTGMAITSIRKKHNQYGAN